MAVSFCKWSEHALARGERNFLPLEELPQRRIVRHADAFVGDLDGKVQVPNRPPEPRDGRGLRNERDLQHRLRLLLDEIHCRIIREKCSATRQRSDEIETKL